MRVVAALTIMGENAFFLKAWLRHYGGQIGLENCYLISTGAGSPEFADLARGCSIIRLPGDATATLARKRGRILNNMVAALRCYYKHVVVTDMDELVVVDPEAGGTLRGFLEQVPGRQVLTPLALELIHREESEPAPLEKVILGPRRHVRPAPYYSKPCIISTDSGLSRNGRLTRFHRLNTPAALYLFRLTYCDRCLSSEVSVFETFSNLSRHEGFDMGGLRRAMHTSWQKRADSGYWSFDCPTSDTHCLLPERFNGVF